MELREYWQIFRHRWWISVALTTLVALFSLVQLRPWQPAPVSYTATLRMLVGVLPAASIDATAYDPRYYAWLTSEYLVDDFTEVVRSELFAKNVSARLAAQEIIVPPRCDRRSTPDYHLAFQWQRRGGVGADRWRGGCGTDGKCGGLLSPAWHGWRRRHLD
jgi:hypothetical protein